MARLGSLSMEDAVMKAYRLVALLAALLIAGLFTWAVAHEHVGAQEEQAIEASAP